MKKPDITPGPWTAMFYPDLGEETLELMKQAGMEPIRMLMNDGAMAVSGQDRHSDTSRVCLVDCKASYKRGAGSTVECPVRDANATLIAASPDLAEALHDLLFECGDYCTAEDGERYRAKARAALLKAGYEE